MIILIDQDGPLADFEKGFLDAWRAQFPNEHFVPLHRRRTFYVRDDYPKELRDPNRQPILHAILGYR